MHTYLRRCYVNEVQLMLNLAAVNCMHTALNSPHPIHAAGGHYTRNSSWINIVTQGRLV